ncbi:MAG: D-alanyl-D-alanine dipeptidase [Azospirillaceae bacterium]
MSVAANAPFLEIAPPGFDVLWDVRYARPDNFLGRPIYRRAAVYLHVDAAQRLSTAIAAAAVRGLRLLIFDGFRPLEAQRVMFEAFPDPRFVSDPDTPRGGAGLAHPRGVAVDLTLADAAGRPLDMGTDFDAMVAASAHDSPAVGEAAGANRALLRQIMEMAGWRAYRAEWWHYQLPEAGRYTVHGDAALSEPLSLMPAGSGGR